MEMIAVGTCVILVAAAWWIHRWRKRAAYVAHNQFGMPLRVMLAVMCGVPVETAIKLDRTWRSEGK